jgi:hypothetical protein
MSSINGPLSKKMNASDKNQLADVHKAEAAQDACLEKCKVT